jgi:hypothetical protein
MSNDFDRRIGESIEPVENPADLVENAKWIEECKKRLALLLPEIKKAKEAFLNSAAEKTGMSHEELNKVAIKQFREKSIQEAGEWIQHLKTNIDKYSKSHEYIELAKIVADSITAKNFNSFKAPDADFDKIVDTFLRIQDEESKKEYYSGQKVNSISELQIMNEIRELTQNNDQIEELYKKWEKLWGDKNSLLYEAKKRGISKQLLKIQAFPSEEANRQQEVGKKVIEGGLKGAKIASYVSQRELKKEKVFKIYDQKMEKLSNMKETEIKKIVAKDAHISLPTLYRYLQERKT